MDQAVVLASARVQKCDGTESCQLKVYWGENQSLIARLEFRDGSADGSRASNVVVLSLPQSGTAFIQGFVAAFVTQKGNGEPSSPTEGDATPTEASVDEQGSQRNSLEPKGQTSIQELAKYFHLPINAAGSRLGICPTVLKKICRKHGLSRWPHRKLRSIDRLLEKLRASVDQADKPFGSSMHTRNLRDRIRDLLQERQEICFESRHH
ncbi:hypothetical protein WJX81_008570 [Elliptochloris bilobata]|uniref:RWP-RK domain-containing protein n=1 Tax=Elliptochloris bilobata TaxID=381761 RepID=A0AAW1R156_9CHLO